MASRVFNQTVSLPCFLPQEVAPFIFPGPEYTNYSLESKKIPDGDFTSVQRFYLNRLVDLSFQPGYEFRATRLNNYTRETQRTNILKSNDIIQEIARVRLETATCTGYYPVTMEVHFMIDKERQLTFRVENGGTENWGQTLSRVYSEGFRSSVWPFVSETATDKKRD